MLWKPLSSTILVCSTWYDFFLFLLTKLHILKYHPLLATTLLIELFIYTNNQSFNTMNGSHYMYISCLARQNKILFVAFCCCCINKTAKLDNPWNFAFVQTGKRIQLEKKVFIICLKENIWIVIVSSDHIEKFHMAKYKLYSSG
jgi:hypothetical protein